VLSLFRVSSSHSRSMSLSFPGMALSFIKPVSYIGLTKRTYRRKKNVKYTTEINMTTKNVLRTISLSDVTSNKTMIKGSIAFTKAAVRSFAYTSLTMSYDFSSSCMSNPTQVICIILAK